METKEEDSRTTKEEDSRKTKRRGTTGTREEAGMMEATRNRTGRRALHRIGETAAVAMVEVGNSNSNINGDRVETAGATMAVGAPVSGRSDSCVRLLALQIFSIV